MQKPNKYQEDPSLFIEPEIPLPSILQSGHQGSHLYLRFLEVISKRIASALTRDLTIFHHYTGKRIVFLNTISWIADKSRKELRQEVKGDDYKWHNTGQTFNIHSPFNTSEWLDYIIAPILVEFHLGNDSLSTDALSCWLKQNLEARFHNSEWLDSLRKQVFQHCQVVPGLYEVIFEIYSSTDFCNINSRVYSEFWLNESLWSELIQEAPQLVHFYYLYTKYLELPVGKSLGVIRDDCIKLGWTPSTWRFLVKHGRKCYMNFYQPHLTDELNTFHMLGFIDIQKRAHLEAPLPSELAVALIAVLPGIDIGSIKIDPRILRIGVEKWKDEDLKDNGKQFAETDWIQMLVWIRDEQPELDKNQWRGGWSTIWRYFQLRKKGVYKSRNWPTLLKEFIIDNWRVVPLADDLSLAQEGMAMKNCVGTVGDECIAGGYQVFSVVIKNSSKRVATVGLKKEDGIWIIDQVRGKCNSTVRYEMDQVALIILENYNKAEEKKEVYTLAD